MPEPIDILQALLEKHCDEEVNVRENEVDHYFYFDRIPEPADLDAAWAVFPEGEEVRRRLAEIDARCNIVPGWGYRVPRTDAPCSDAELVALVRKNIESYRPILWTDESWGEPIKLLRADYQVQIASSDVEFSSDDENPLQELIHSSIGDFLIDELDTEQPHYDLLYNWAIYLTKCDEVATYLLWPCLENTRGLPADTPDAGFRLWLEGCRDRYWIKDNNAQSRVVYVRRPEPNEDLGHDC